MEILYIPPEHLRAPQESINILCEHTNTVINIPTAGDFIILGDQHAERSKLLKHLLKQWRSSFTLVTTDITRIDHLIKAGGTVTTGVDNIIPKPTDWHGWANFTRIALHRFKRTSDWWNDVENTKEDESISEGITVAVNQFRDRNIEPTDISAQAWSHTFLNNKYRHKYKLELEQYNNAFTSQNPSTFLAIQKPESLQHPFPHPATVNSVNSRISFTAVHTVLANVTECCVIVEDAIPEHTSITNLKLSRNLLGMYGGSLILTGHPPRSKRLKGFDGIFLIFNPIDLVEISLLERIWKFPHAISQSCKKLQRHSRDQTHFFVLFEGSAHIGVI